MVCICDLISEEMYPLWKIQKSESTVHIVKQWVVAFKLLDLLQDWRSPGRGMTKQNFHLQKFVSLSCDHFCCLEDKKKKKSADCCVLRQTINVSIQYNSTDMLHILLVGMKKMIHIIRVSVNLWLSTSLFICHCLLFLFENNHFTWQLTLFTFQVARR